MAHIRGENSKLWYPQSIHDAIDSQKMFIDNNRQLEILFSNLKNGIFKVGNTNNLDGIPGTGFVRNFGYTTDINMLNNTKYPINYECIVSGNIAASIGLERNAFYHIKYFAHPHNNGYGIQIAIPYANANDWKYKFRNAPTGTVWSEWDNIGDGYDANTLGGHSPNEYMRIYNHTCDENNGIDGSGIDLDSVVQCGVHIFSGNFSSAINAPFGWHSNISMIVIGSDNILSQMVQIGGSLCFRNNSLGSRFSAWNYTNGGTVINAVVE